MELLITIAIIAILSAVVFTAIGSQRAKARDARRISEIKELATALSVFDNLEGYYPESIYPDAASPLVAKGQYTKMPLDPFSDLQYAYIGLGCYMNECSGFHLGASLETENVILESDADGNSGSSGFDGGDIGDCSSSKQKKVGWFCYDLWR